MKKDTYTQCQITKGNGYQIAWIPTTFAVIGKIIKIKEIDGWDDGWKVSNVYGTRSADKVEQHSRDHIKFHVE